MSKLLSVTPAMDGVHKFEALFENASGHVKAVKFGRVGYQDYTQHGDKERRAAYRRRHRKDLLTGDPTRAGYLSRYLLWGDSTDMGKNIADYRKKFSL